MRPNLPKFLIPLCHPRRGYLLLPYSRIGGKSLRPHRDSCLLILFSSGATGFMLHSRLATKRLRQASPLVFVSELVFAVVMVVLADVLTFFRQLIHPGQIFVDNDTFERDQPVIVVALTRVVFTAFLSFF